MLKNGFTLCEAVLFIFLTISWKFNLKIQKFLMRVEKRLLNCSYFAVNDYYIKKQGGKKYGA